MIGTLCPSLIRTHLTRNTYNDIIFSLLTLAWDSALTASLKLTATSSPNFAEISSRVSLLGSLYRMLAIQIGNALNSDGIKAVTSAMTVLLVIAWLFVAGSYVKAILRRQILWEGKDEDVGMDID